MPEFSQYHTTFPFSSPAAITVTGGQSRSPVDISYDPDQIQRTVNLARLVDVADNLVGLAWEEYPVEAAVLVLSASQLLNVSQELNITFQIRAADHGSLSLRFMNSGVNFLRAAATPLFATFSFSFSPDRAAPGNLRPDEFPPKPFAHFASSPRSPDLYTGSLFYAARPFELHSTA